MSPPRRLRGSLEHNMLGNTPSRTAYATTLLRAIHATLDDPPPVLDDTLAINLLPGAQRRYLRRMATLPTSFWRPLRRRYPAFTAMRGQVVTRSRYAEDQLHLARSAGAMRYVVLGAGLDTFALRQGSPAIDVLEIDHPATQRWKQNLLAQRGMQLPQSLTFLPIDFERESLAERFPAATAADFISWLGVTYYLSREGITTTLTTLAETTRPGSRLALDYWSEAPPDYSAPLLWGTRLAVAMQGEPMRSFFEPEEIEALALAAGWRVLENLSAEAQRQRYLAKRRDGLRVPAFAYLLLLER